MMKHVRGAAAALLLAAAAAPPATAEEIRVTDGDTIRLGEERIRILGLDAPELHGRCREERRLAARARDRLAELIGARGIAIERVRRKDRYGRTLATVRAGGVDVAMVLIAEGLARPYEGGRRDGWCGYPVPRRRP